MGLDASEIIAEARKLKVAGRRRSPVRNWLEAHYAELAGDLPSWVELARLLAAEGIKDAVGKEPTGAALAHAWHRMKLDREKRGRRPGAPRVETSETPAPEFRSLGTRRNQGE